MPKRSEKQNQLRRETYNILKELNLDSSQRAKLRDIAPQNIPAKLKEMKIVNTTTKKENKIPKTAIEKISKKVLEIKQKITPAPAPKQKKIPKKDLTPQQAKNRKAKKQTKRLKPTFRWDYINVEDHRVHYLSRYTYNVEYMVGVKVGRGQYIEIEELAMSISSMKEMSKDAVLREFWSNIDNAPANFYFSKDIIRKSIRIDEAFYNEKA